MTELAHKPDLIRAASLLHRPAVFQRRCESSATARHRKTQRAAVQRNQSPQDRESQSPARSAGQPVLRTVGAVDAFLESYLIGSPLLRADFACAPLFLSE